MFREMRKKSREISREESIKILEKCDEGVLSTIGENGYPYGVTVNYVYVNDCIYFHSATKGHKLDNIAYNNKVSFSIMDDITILPDKFSTLYSSVIVFGEASLVDDDEKKFALLELIKKYSPEFLESGKVYIEKAAKATNVVKIEINHLTGKSNNPNN